MKRLKTYKTNKNTINKIIFIVFFLVILTSIMLFNIYGKWTSKNTIILTNQKIDKILYLFFSDLITEDIINKEGINNIMIIHKNSDGEILTVDYDLEKSYKIMTNISKVLKKGILDLENGNIDISLYDKYLKGSKKGLIIFVPLFLGSDNVFLNNLGPRIPVIINFNENMLTNIKTRVTNYGLNNALLEVYLTVEMQKLVITPIHKDEEKFYYEILLGATVINGRVPNFYGGVFETRSGILDIPIE